MTFNIKFDDKGLIPAVIQDEKTKKVLMLAYMNEESLEKTLVTGTTWFYSRSKKRLWNKGETSGNYQKVKRISFDCDCDALLIEVEPCGNSCHTGSFSCFFNEFYVNDDYEYKEDDIILKLYERVVSRRESPKADSYTNYLFSKGLDKILKKVGEEASEVIIASKNESKEEMIYEISDLLYHVIVLMVDKGISIEDIKKEIKKRYENK